MTNSQRLAMIRRALLEWWKENPEKNRTPNTDDSTEENSVLLASTANRSFQESVLIRDGFYCGRRFRNDQIEAVWFMEEDQVKIFAAGSQQLLASLQRDDISQLATRDDSRTSCRALIVLPQPEEQRRAA